ncbi:MAG: NUDIX domain-containing protein, partial [Bacteroidales bacterium]
MYTYKYPRPSVTVDCILISQNNSILLIQRGGEPFKDKWAIPGGFIEMDESLEVACYRELEEETGIKVKKLSQFKAYGAVDRDPRGRTISVVFYSFTDNEVEAKAGDDAANAQWFQLD